MKHHDAADADSRREIQGGALKAGAMIPTEHELMEQYAISRNVVRQAISDLVEAAV